MKLNRLIFFVAAFVLLLAQTGVAQEDVSKYPSKPITYISPAPPGTGIDLSTRLMARELEKILGKPVVVENKPGAALVIGTSAVATAKPDGYTIGFTGGPPLWFTPLLEKVPYDPLKDLRMVAQFGAFNSAVAVSGDSPFKTFKELMNYARQNPKKVTCGTLGTNSITHIAFEEIAKQEGAQITHIPFKGSNESTTAVLGGHITFAGGDMPASLLESGKLKLLLILKSEKSVEYPDVPTAKELGYNIFHDVIIAIITPKAVPDPIVKKLDDAVVKAMKEPTFLKGMKDLNMPVVYHGSKELDVSMAQSYEHFKKVFTEKGLLVK